LIVADTFFDQQGRFTSTIRNFLRYKSPDFQRVGGFTANLPARSGAMTADDCFRLSTIQEFATIRSTQGRLNEAAGAADASVSVCPSDSSV